MKKRLLALILASLLLAQTLSGCAEKTDDSSKETDAAATTPSSAETEPESETEFSRENVKDDLPELDYNGESAVIIARDKSWFAGEMYVEDLNGEVVNDAVYQRDLNVEERLGVTIDYELVPDTDALVDKNVTAGSDEYTLNVGNAVECVKHGVMGNYYNLLGDKPIYLNLDQPWWSQYYTEQSEILGCSFFALGDMTFSRIKLAFVTYVNLKMMNDHGFGTPFDMVREGKWTIDREMEMASAAFEDKNGNGKADPKDSYGMSMGGLIGLDMYWSAFDLTICEKDENNNPIFTVDEERMSSVLEKMNTYYASEYVYTPAQGTDDGEQDFIAKMFADDRMMFSPLRILHTDDIREMESDYTLIPLPKWSEEQDNYYTFIHDQYSVVGIPVSVQNPEMASAIMEAMAADSYRHVTPAYYDLVLNGKYTRDPNSAEMIEIAMDGIKIDFGWIYTYSLGSCSQNLLRELIYNKKDNFSSEYSKKRSSTQRAWIDSSRALRKSRTKDK